MQCQAIKELLICEKILKNPDFSKRKFFEKIVKHVENKKGKVYIFSANHSSGEKLMELSGIAAILKFEINFDDLEL